MARADGAPIEIAFTGGESHDVDDKLLPRGKFELLQNLEYDKIGRLIRREDIVAGAETNLGGVFGMTSSRKAVRAVGHGDQLLFFGDGTMWSYADGEDKLTQFTRCNYKMQRATFDPVEPVTSGSVSGGPRLVDMCGFSGFFLVAWMETIAAGTNHIYITVIDESTGAHVYSGLQVSSSDSYLAAPATIRCVASGDRYLHVLWVETAVNGTGDNSYHRVLSVTVDTTTMAVGSPTERARVKENLPHFDADIGRDGPVLAWTAANGVSGQCDVEIEEFNDAWVSQRSTTVVSGLTAADVDGFAMAAAKDASDSYYVVISGPAGGGG